MIAFLSGTVAHKGEGVLVMDVGGVGYRLLMAQSSIMALPPVDEDAKVFCSMSVSDAGIFLYGFIDEQERLMFDRLTSINGVGPKIPAEGYDQDSHEGNQDVLNIAEVVVYWS